MNIGDVRFSIVHSQRSSESALAMLVVNTTAITLSVVVSDCVGAGLSCDAFI